MPAGREGGEPGGRQRLTALRASRHHTENRLYPRSSGTPRSHVRATWRSRCSAFYACLWYNPARWCAASEVRSSKAAFGSSSRWKGRILSVVVSSVPTAVITGASTGIGEACAVRLDKAGWRVFAGVRKDADGERLRQQASDRLTPVMIDVTDAVSISSAKETIASAVGDGGLDGLVNNAGISVVGPLEFLTSEDLRHQLEVNVIGQMAMIQALLPFIRKAPGRIVNIGSIAGKMATPFLGPYAASKFAMEALTDSLRQELRPWNIHVAIVEPGSIATPIWNKAQAGADEIEKNLPEEGMKLYSKAFSAMREAAQKFEAQGIPPDRVAKFVEHALTAKRPKTRYVVGFDAQVQRVLSRVPDRVRDWLVAWQLGLPKRE